MIILFLFFALLTLQFSAVEMRAAELSSQTDPMQPSLAKDQAAENYYTVIKGDTLWQLAARYLGNPFRWSEIWNLNKESIKNPDLIYPDQKIFFLKSAEASEPLQNQPAISQEEIEPQEQPLEKSETREAPTELGSENVPSSILLTGGEAEEATHLRVQDAEHSPPLGLSSLKEKEKKEVLSELGQVVAIQKKLKPSGKISESGSEKILMETEDEVTIKFNKPQILPAGTIFTVYRERESLLDPEGNLTGEEDAAIILETVGAVELTQNLTPYKSLAKVAGITAPLELGDSVRIWEKP